MGLMNLSKKLKSVDMKIDSAYASTVNEVKKATELPKRRK